MIAESKVFRFLGLSKMLVVLLLAMSIGLFYVFIKNIAPSYNILINVYMQLFSLAIVVSYAVILVNVVRPLFFPFSQGMMALFFTVSMMMFAFLMGAQFCLIDALNFMARVSSGRLPYLAPLGILFVVVVTLSISYEIAERRGMLRTKSFVTVLALSPFLYLAFKSLYLYYVSIFYSGLALYIPYYIAIGLLALLALVSLTISLVSPRVALGRFQSKVQSAMLMRLLYVVVAFYSIALALVQFSIFSGLFLLAAILFVYIYLRPVSLKGHLGVSFGASLFKLYVINIAILLMFLTLNMYVFYPIFLHTFMMFVENTTVMAILMVSVVSTFPLVLRLFRSL